MGIDSTLMTLYRKEGDMLVPIQFKLADRMTSGCYQQLHEIPGTTDYIENDKIVMTYTEPNYPYVESAVFVTRQGADFIVRVIENKSEFTRVDDYQYRSAKSVFPELDVESLKTENVIDTQSGNENETKPKNP
jgi:hypothetical protein